MLLLMKLTLQKALSALRDLSGSTQACREEEVDPQQQGETLEENKESQLSTNGERLVAEISHDEEPPEEGETSSSSEPHGSEESPLDGPIPVDPTDRPASKAKAVIVVSRELQENQTSEEIVPQTAKSDSSSPPASVETETQSRSAERHGSDPSEGQGGRQGVGEGADAPPVATTEPLSEEADPVGQNAEPQQEPEEAENDEAEETPSKSQAQVPTASGKKKRKKKKGKKKGASHENKNQDRAGTTEEKDSTTVNNRITAEPDTSGSKTLTEPKPVQEQQEPDQVEGPEPPENRSPNEPKPNAGSNDHDKEKMSKEAEVMDSTEVPPLTETETLENQDPRKPTRTSSRVISGSKTDEDGDITGPDPEENLLTSKSTSDLDGWTSGEDGSTREDASGVLQSNTDPVSEDKGITKNTEMLDQRDDVGSSERSGHTGPRLEDKWVEEESPEADPSGGFLQNETLKESLPESWMVEADGKGTLEEDSDPEPDVLPSKGSEDPSTISGLQESNTGHVSGDLNQEETLDDSSEERVEVLQKQVETSEPEKPESVLETSKSSSQVETIQRPDESEMGEEDLKPSLDVKKMGSTTGPDPEPNLLTAVKVEDPGKEFTPDNSTPGDVSGVQNLPIGSEAVDGEENTSEPAGEEDGEAENGQVPAEESRTGSEIKEERSTSSSPSNGDTIDQPTNPSMKDPEVGPGEAAEPDDGEPEISEEVCREDESLNGGAPEDPPEQASFLHMKDEVEIVELTGAETGETEKEASPNNKETNSSQSLLADHMNEPNTEINHSPPHVQMDSDEEDEGQSFDFDESDMEAAIESSLSNKPEQEDVDEGAEFDRKTSELCQSNTETEDGEEKVSEDGSGLPPQNSPACGDTTSEEMDNVPENVEQKMSVTIEEENVPENVEQTMSSEVEEGLEAIELPSDSQKTPEQTSSGKEVPQSGRDSKKKRGKGKTKEDCKMS